jgi:hypothetical protein
MGPWRKPHKEELHNLYFSPFNIRIKLGQMKWACMEEKINAVFIKKS